MRVHLVCAGRRSQRPGMAPGGRKSQSAFLFNYLHLGLGADILGSGGSVTSTRGAPRLPPRLASPAPSTPPFYRPLALSLHPTPPFSVSFLCPALEVREAKLAPSWVRAKEEAGLRVTWGAIQTKGNIHSSRPLAALGNRSGC
jgi:hypothetical protein